MGNITSKGVDKQADQYAFSLLLEILEAPEMNESAIKLLYTPIIELRCRLPEAVQMPSCFARDILTLRSLFLYITAQGNNNVLNQVNDNVLDQDNNNMLNQGNKTVLNRGEDIVLNRGKDIVLNRGKDIVLNQAIHIYATELIRPQKSILALLHFTVNHFLTSSIKSITHWWDNWRDSRRLVNILHTVIYCIVENCGNDLPNFPHAEAWLTKIKLIDLLFKVTEEVRPSDDALQETLVEIHSLNSLSSRLSNIDPEWRITRWIIHLANWYLNQDRKVEADLLTKALTALITKTTCPQLDSLIPVICYVSGLSKIYYDEPAALCSLCDFVTGAHQPSLEEILSMSRFSTTFGDPFNGSQKLYRQLAVALIFQNELFTMAPISFKGKLALALMPLFSLPQDDQSTPDAIPLFNPENIITITHDTLLLCGVECFVQAEYWIEAYAQIAQERRASIRAKLIETFWYYLVHCIMGLHEDNSNNGQAIDDLKPKHHNIASHNDLEKRIMDNMATLVGCAALPWSPSDQEFIIDILTLNHPQLVVRWHLARDNYVAAAEFLYDWALDIERTRNHSQRYARLCQCQNAVTMAHRSGQLLPREWPRPLSLLLLMTSACIDLGRENVMNDSKEELMIELLERGLMSRFVELLRVEPDEWSLELLIGFIVDRLVRKNRSMDEEDNENLSTEGLVENTFDITLVPLEIITCSLTHSEYLWLWYVLTTIMIKIPSGEDRMVTRTIELFIKHGLMVPNWLTIMVSERDADNMVRVLGEAGQLEAVATLLQRPTIAYQLGQETVLYLNQLVSAP